MAKHVVSTKSAVRAAKPGKAAGAADPDRPWQSRHGHDPVIPHRQVSAALMMRFERQTALLDLEAERLMGESR